MTALVARNQAGTVPSRRPVLRRAATTPPCPSRGRQTSADFRGHKRRAPLILGAPISTGTQYIWDLRLRLRMSGGEDVWRDSKMGRFEDPQCSAFSNVPAGYFAAAAGHHPLWVVRRHGAPVLGGSGRRSRAVDSWSARSRRFSRPRVPAQHADFDAIAITMASSRLRVKTARRRSIDGDGIQGVGASPESDHQTGLITMRAQVRGRRFIVGKVTIASHSSDSSPDIEPVAVARAQPEPIAGQRAVRRWSERRPVRLETQDLERLDVLAGDGHVAPALFELGNHRGNAG